jgi:hypothetical protein
MQEDNDNDNDNGDGEEPNSQNGNGNRKAQSSRPRFTIRDPLKVVLRLLINPSLIINLSSISHQSISHQSLINLPSH